MPGRGRTRGDVARRVDDLSSRRDDLDTELTRRREREDAALRRWAGLMVRHEEIETIRDAELERLETERDRVRDEATRQATGVEADQAEVLLELNRDGRTVEQLSTLFALPIKQVRDMLRTAKSGTATAIGHAAQTHETPRPQTGATATDTDARPERESERPPDPRPAGDGQLPAGQLATGPAAGDGDRQQAQEQPEPPAAAMAGSGSSDAARR